MLTSLRFLPFWTRCCQERFCPLGNSPESEHKRHHVPPSPQLFFLSFVGFPFRHCDRRSGVFPPWEPPPAAGAGATFPLLPKHCFTNQNVSALKPFCVRPELSFLPCVVLNSYNTERLCLWTATLAGVPSFSLHPNPGYCGHEGSA